MKQTLSKECDTLLRYTGEGSVPLMAGDSPVKFSVSRRLHRVPKWLAERLAENDPDEWEIPPEGTVLPAYTEDDPLDAFDVDTETGLSKIRRKLFDDSEGFLREVVLIVKTEREAHAKVVEELNERIETLEAVIASDPELTRNNDGEPSEDATRFALSLIDEAAFEEHIASQNLHNARVASLRKLRLAYEHVPSGDNLKAFTDRLIEWGVTSNNETLLEA